MTTQPEVILENNFIKQLTDMGYEHVHIRDAEGLLHNLKSQLEKFNNTTLSDKEFDVVLNHLAKGSVFEKAKTLRDRYNLQCDNGDSAYIQFFDSENWNKNHYQVTNQITQKGSYKNRCDVTILVNGMPVVQVELKRRAASENE